MLAELEMDITINDSLLSPINPKYSETDDDPIDILLVEDVASDAILLRLALDKAQIAYNLFTVHRGSDALEYLTTNHFSEQNEARLPDVILLDLGLPGMDGFEILERLKRSSAKIRAVPIIILSGYGDFEYLRKTSDLYIPAYITKPCLPKQLKEIISRVCRRRKHP